MKLRIACVLAGFLSLALSLVQLTFAQTSTETPPALPRLVRFSGVVKDLNGNPMTGVVGITFALYSEQTGGAALWMETQNVTADGNGRYVAVLGSTKAEGLPMGLFTSEQARWVGVQVAGQAEQPRVLLVSAPYALKAGDAETIGGLPPSAFVLSAAVSGGGSANSESTPTSASAMAIANTSSDVTTNGGTVNALPLWTTATNIQSSALTQTGTGATAKVGIGTITPAATLDVRGTGTIRGALSLPAAGTATASKGFNSQALNLSASAFSSTTSTAVNQVFQWQAEPAGNDTSTLSGTLNLLFGEGATKPSETGLHIANNGQITFATGQLFPGAGTITGITTASGSGLAGGGTSGTLSLNVPAAGITNAMLANSKITLNASTAGGLTTPGAMTLGSAYTIGLKTCSANQILQYSGTVWNCSGAGTGTITGVTTASGSGLSGGGTSGTLNLSVNPAVVPELATANTFTNLQTINAASTTSPALNITNTSGTGIVISAPSTIFGYGLDVANAGDFGVAVESAGTYGVYAKGNYQGGYFNGASGGSYSENDTDSEGAVAAYAYEFGTTYQDIGFWGYSASTLGVGVYGQAVQASATGEPSDIVAIGVWGDTGEAAGMAVVATADQGYGLVGSNNSGGAPTALLENASSNPSSSPVLATFGNSFGGECTIDVSGNLHCNGTLSGVAPVDGGARKVALNSVQSPEAWFEDAGSGQLSGGQAVVNIESVFGQTINTGVEYHVFLTPNGDCKGLYVAEKSATSFVVKELGGGTSSIAFDYRIMAKRKGFENGRLADVTKTFTIKRPVKSAANARHLPSAQSIRQQTQEHAKLRTAARLNGPASNKKQ